jgi:hypothetical protein
MLKTKGIFSGKYAKFGNFHDIRHELLDFERRWVIYYLMADGRFTARSKLLIVDYLNNNKSNLQSNRSLLRSFCVSSGVKRGVSSHFFWCGRHALNS